MSSSKTRPLIAILLIAVAIAIVVFSVYSPSKSDSVSVGAIVPLTGDIATYGNAVKQGLDLALEEINVAGGVNGLPLQILYEDNRGGAKDSLTAMEKLISVDKVRLVIGPGASSNAIALCPVANRERIVLITPMSSSPELTEKGGGFFFRVCPSDVVQASMMADWIIEDGHKTAAVIHVRNSWGEGLKDEFLNKAGERELDVLVVEACNENDRDLRTQLSKVQAQNPDAIYCITYSREGGALLRQAKEMALDCVVYGADVWGSPELTESAGDAATGVKVIVPAEFSGPLYDRFAEKFEAEYGTLPDVYSCYAYDLLHLVAHALQADGEGDALRTAIAGQNYDGVTGKTQFDDNGDVAGKGFQRKVLD